MTQSGHEGLRIGAPQTDPQPYFAGHSCLENRRECWALGWVMRRLPKARSKLARKAEMPRHRAAPRLARERGEYPRRDELRPTLDTALDAVVVMKSDAVVADWNDRAVGVFGWSRLPRTKREGRLGLLRYWQQTISAVQDTTASGGISGR